MLSFFCFIIHWKVHLVPRLPSSALQSPAPLQCILGGFAVGASARASPVTLVSFLWSGKPHGSTYGHEKQLALWSEAKAGVLEWLRHLMVCFPGSGKVYLKVGGIVNVLWGKPPTFAKTWQLCLMPLSFASSL